MKFSTEADDLLALRECITSTTTLINSFQLALRAPTSPPPIVESPPQPLALLSDSCKILKAQTTKLSLLILNKPFTPTAITYILKVCSSGCLPAMMSALELCPSKAYTDLLHSHIKTSLLKIMTELLSLIASIPQNEHGIDHQSRGTLASTGVLWAECDQLVTLASDGLVPLVIRKAEEHHGLLKDAIAELEEWDPEEDDSDSDIDTLSSIKPRYTPTTAKDPSCLAVGLENLSVSPIGMLRKRSVTILRTVRLLYPALQKRRMSTFPNISSTTLPEVLPSSTLIRGLDSIMSFAQDFTEAADEIAGALYEGNESEVLGRIQSLQEEGASCASSVRKDWKGEEDEFSGWLEKWETRLKGIGTTER